MEQYEEDLDLHEVGADSEACLARDVLEAICDDSPGDDEHFEPSYITGGYPPATGSLERPLKSRALFTEPNTPVPPLNMIERNLLLWDSNPVSSIVSYYFVNY